MMIGLDIICTQISMLRLMQKIKNPSEIANSGIDDLDPLTKLLTIRVKNKRDLIKVYLNINSIPNKIGGFKFLISKNVDTLVISETKLDESFPTTQFQTEGFKKPFRYDRNANRGGILVFSRDKFQQIA